MINKDKKRTKQISEDEYINVLIHLRNNKKMSFDRISSHLNIPKTTIFRDCKQACEKLNIISTDGRIAKDVKGEESRGRPSAFYDEEEAEEYVKTFLIEEAERGKAIKSAEEVREEMYNGDLVENEISINTVRKYLKKWGLSYEDTKEAPLLTKEMKINRVKAANENLIVPYTQVMFSDESMIRLNDTTTKAWVLPSMNVPREQFYKGPEGIMVFGIFSCYGFSNLQVFRRKSNSEKGKRGINSEIYCDNLKESLFPLIECHPKDSTGGHLAYFLQDNARIHTSAYTKKFLSDNGVKTVNHPKYSPDMNPIEIVWHLLKEDLKRDISNFKNLDTLEAAAKKSWYKLMSDSNLREKLAHRWLRCLSCCIYNHGDFLTDELVHSYTRQFNVPHLPI